jgi:hypothetical protein
MRRKLPFGVAQIGKAFRNEITPGNFTFRTREFEQMEIEYFVKPGEDEAAHQAWIDARTQWYVDLGMRRENLRQREQAKDELAHYAKRCVDLEYKFPMGWSELEGSRTGPTTISRRTAAARESRRRRRAQVLRPGTEEAHRPVRHRAVGGRGPRDAGVPVRRVRRIAGQGAAGRGGRKLRELVQSFAKSVDKKDPKRSSPRRSAADRGGREDRGRPARDAARAAGAVGRRGGQQHRGVQEGARRL